MSSATADPRAAVVHLVTRLDLGGAQQNTLYTASHLDPDRFAASIICGPGGVLDDAARTLGVPVTFCPLLVRDIRPHAEAAALMQLRRALRAHAAAVGGPLVVHTHSSKAGVLGRVAARLEGARAVVHTVHGFAFHEGQRPLVRWGLSAVERLLAPTTDALVFVSQRDMDTAARLGMLRPGQAHLIRSGIHLAGYAPNAARRQEVRARLGIAPQAPLVLTVANFKPQKNPLLGLRAFASVAAARPDAHWLFAGDGPLRNVFLDGVAALGLRPRVHVLGWQTHVSPLYCAADVFMLSSDHEGLPRSAVEALASGVPVVATDAGGTGEVVQPAWGTVVPLGNATALADGVLRWLAHPSSNVATHVLPHLAPFDIDQMVRTQEQLYQRLLAHPA